MSDSKFVIRTLVSLGAAITIVIVFLRGGLATAEVGNHPQGAANKTESGQWFELGNGSATGDGISDTINASRSPSVAIAANGSAIVAWEDYSYRGGGGSEIDALQWNGSTWSAIGDSKTAGGISQSQYAVPYGADVVYVQGVPYVTWIHGSYTSLASDGWDSSATNAPASIDSADEDGFDEAYVKRWDGVRWLEVGLDSASEGGLSNSRNAANVSIAQAANSDVYAAWRNRDPGNENNNVIYVRRWNGQAWVEMKDSAVIIQISSLYRQSSRSRYQHALCCGWMVS